jgi:hypothetical protein
MFTLKKTFLVAVLMILLVLSACNLPSAVTPQPGDPNLIYTAAAQTVAAQLTQAASGIVPTNVPPTNPPVQVPTATQQPPVEFPTATSIPPTVVIPTSTTVPPTQKPPTPVPPTATQVPCDQMDFIKDVTYPDNTEVEPGEVFIKTWRIKNTGSCTWNSSYKLVFINGDAMGGPASQQLTTSTVKPGESIDIDVELTAPDVADTYKGNWKIQNGAGARIGLGPENKPFWVQVVVVEKVNYDCLAKAKNADWRNTTDDVPFGDREDDSGGIAAYGINVKLEDGKTYAKVLGTYPERIDNGWISGTFDEYKVKDGDHFRSLVGFRSSCTDGKVKFQLSYEQGGVQTDLKSWTKECDGSLLSLDYNLADLEGETVQFILTVNAAGSFKNDKAIWINPRIQQ